MTNLVVQLGDSYIREFFMGAVFTADGKLYLIRNCMDGEVQVSSCSLAGEDAWRSTSVPHEALLDFKSIAWPKLGYRNMMAGEFGNVATFVSSTRSTMRGLRSDQLQWKQVGVSDSTSINIFNNHPAAGNQYQLRQVFAPKFYTYKEGINLIREGKWCSFAINEDLAVAVSTSAADAFCDILFRDKVVGKILENGDIHLSNKVIKRSTLRRVLSEA